MEPENYSWTSHGIRIHPTLWEWAKQDAVAQGYEGGASGLISGLILYNHALRDRRHWLTADLINHPAKLEAAIQEIKNHNPMEGSKTWLEHIVENRLTEMFDKNNPNSEHSV